MSAASHPPHVGMPHEQHAGTVVSAQCVSLSLGMQSHVPPVPSQMPLNQPTVQELQRFLAITSPDSRTQPHLSSAEHMSKVLANQARDSVRHHYEV